jgi:hypothetical protein
MQFHASLIGGETGKARSIAQTYLEEATTRTLCLTSLWPVFCWEKHA